MKAKILYAALFFSVTMAIYFYSLSTTSGGKKLLSENESLSVKIVHLEKLNQDLKSRIKADDLKYDQLKLENQSLKNLLNKVNNLQAVNVSKTKEAKEVSNEVSLEEKERQVQLKKFLSEEIQKNYSVIFKDLGLTESEIDLVKSKLLSRDTEIVSAVFKSIMQSLPTEEGQSQEQVLAKSILESIEKTNAELAVDLGDSFAEFRQKEQSNFTLRELKNFEGLLPENSLADEQRISLNDLMFEHHNSVLQNVSVGATTFKQADEELVNKSADFLDADQQKALGNYLKMKRGGK